MQNESSETGDVAPSSTKLEHDIHGRRVFFRFLKWAAIGLGVFLILGVIGFYQYANWAGRKAWEETKAELEAKGAVFDIEALNPEMPPDAENFAMCDVIRSLWDYEVGDGDLVYANSAVRNEFLEMKVPRRRLAGRSPEADFSSGLRFDVESWPLVFEEDDEFDEFTNWTVDKIHGVLTQHDSQIKSLVIESRNRPKNQIPVAFPENYIDQLAEIIPEQSDILRFAPFLKIRGHFALEKGEIQMAADCVELMIRMAETAESRQKIIPHLVSLVISEMALRVIWDGIENRAWRDADLHGFQTQLTGISQLASLAKTQEVEGVINFIYGVDYISKTPGELFSVVNDPVSERDPLDYETWIPIFPMGWWEQNRAIGVRKTWNELIFPARNEDIATLLKFSDSVDHLPFSHKFYLEATSANWIVDKPLTAQTQIDLVISACTVERFILKHRRLPESVEEIRAANLGEFREDLYNPGSPLQYRNDPDNGRYLLYSYGPNQIDNGGVVTPSHPSSPFGDIDEDKSDLVWRYSSPKILQQKADYDASLKTP